MDLNREIRFRTSRSSGSGGQHVNKVSTRVELLFNVDASTELTSEQKQRIKDKLGSRINKDGILIVASQEYRSQKRNKEDAVSKFYELIRNALKRKKRRKRTSIPKKARKKRLDAKKKRGELKKQRRKPKLPPND